MKKIIRLTESDLVKLVKKVIKEQQQEIYRPEDRGAVNQIVTGRMMVYPKDRCVASNLVTPYLNRGLTDLTANVNAAFPTKNRQPFDKAVYYFWNGGDIFKPTNYEGQHLVNVCPSSNNKGLQPYVSGFPITGVSTEFKNVKY